MTWVFAHPVDYMLKINLLMTSRNEMFNASQLQDVANTKNVSQEVRLQQLGVVRRMLDVVMRIRNSTLRRVLNPSTVTSPVETGAGKPRFLKKKVFIGFRF